MKIYFIIMVAVWLPWGIQCIFNISNITEIIGVSALNPNGTTDIRVMYGGVQTGVGLMALIAFFKPSLRQIHTFLSSNAWLMHGPYKKLWSCSRR